MRVGLLALLLLTCAAPVGAEGWLLEPQVVGPGGVARLVWRGNPGERMVVRFRGEQLHLASSPAGPMTLLGVDLEQAEGVYPIQATVSDARGRTTHYGLFLRVERPPRKPRAPERLKLPTNYVTPQQPELLARIRQERALLKELYASRTSPQNWEPFQKPVATQISSSFGRGRLMNGKTPSLHAGIDFGGTAGTPVQAAAAGRVAFAGDLYFTGLTVILDHGDGLFTLYGHLQRLTCRSDDRVAAAAVIGELGSSGRATGPHLHWGAKLRGARIDPLELVRLTGGEKR